MCVYLRERERETREMREMDKEAWEAFSERNIQTDVLSLKIIVISKLREEQLQRF